MKSLFDWYMRKKFADTGIGRFLKKLGPGVITGASDDDPSGIATYSQAGAQFGLATLWTALLSFPLMAAIQGMCARIGLVTSQGLTVTLKQYYPRPVLYLMLLVSFPAITLNVGADIQGMGAVCHMMVPAVPVWMFCVAITALMMFTIIRYSYQKIAMILKWLCVSLFLYLIVPFLLHLNWMDILKHTFIPDIHWNNDYLSIIVAILGTTISPYLFFWQTTMEAEEQEHSGNGKKRAQGIWVDKRMLKDMRTDVNAGMLFSNIVMFFIILTTGSVLFSAGINQVETVDQAAKALEPLVGKLASLMFTLGVLGTGLLAIPVLTGSQSYMLAETLGWEEGLDKTFAEAKSFYISIIISLLVGLSLDFLGVNPIKALLYTAIVYGLTAPVMIAMIMHIGNNKKIMKEYTNSWFSNLLGALTLILMTAAAAALIYSLF
ncbi:NRAMP (natural resistance-associated macrophage protein)-like metal ion transporter [Chitinophaga polysaccharea]|uniref:NRAMP (Natural resistance-associated macrophage protein)-like metal ion transporter n=1 Tax=Chitinophaga polysaccharea TaxID=1293035 RepID=A0A561PCB9_9BACT|nr:divalent metal cation transporter [Chitinophaga polysaccharea]TWF35748.1 NRAMP (natural resistance-associated macrophage protein)-like metal ion transporter [Chitinophaga polysaccharea]